MSAAILEEAAPAKTKAKVDSNLPPPVAMNRFQIAALAFRRARQLHNGARPRVEHADGHKNTRVAVLEVMADTISWSLADKVTDP